MVGFDIQEISWFFVYAIILVALTKGDLNLKKRWSQLALISAEVKSTEVYTVSLLPLDPSW